MCYDREGRLHQTVPDANKPLGFKDQDACEKKIESFHKCVLAIMRVGYIKRHKMQTVRDQGPRCMRKRYIELPQVRAPSWFPHKQIVQLWACEGKEQNILKRPITNRAETLKVRTTTPDKCRWNIHWNSPCVTWCDSHRFCESHTVVITDSVTCPLTVSASEVLQNVKNQKKCIFKPKNQKWGKGKSDRLK